MSFWPFSSTKERDPVCRMDVDRKKAAATTIHNGDKYYFCSVRCKDAFARKPKKYVKQTVATVASTNGSCH